MAVITALTLTLLLGFSALAVDLAGLRSDRSANQSISDLAASAGAVNYRPDAPGSAETACLQALEYARVNLGLASAPPGSPGCSSSSTFGGGWVCNPSTPRTAVFSDGTYTIRITIPVPLSDALMQGMDHGAANDGEPCQRIGVSISRDRELSLGAFVGMSSSETQASAVAMNAPKGEEGEYASLIVLDRLGCEVLSASGNDNAELRVNRLTRVEDGETVVYPAIISVDTRADSCGSNKPVIYVSGNAKVRSEDFIFSYAVEQLQPQSQIYDASYIGANYAASQLWARPTGGPRITRSPVDYLVNCLPDYAPYTTQRWSPHHNTAQTTGTIPGCTKGTPAYIKSLHDNLATLGNPGNNTINSATQLDNLRLAGWSVFPDDFAGASCTGSGASGVYGPPATGVLPGLGAAGGRQFYVNCGTGGQSLSPTNLEFRGVHTVVHRNEFSMSTGSQIYRITGPSDRGTVLFQQRGGLQRSGGTIDWQNVFAYVEDGYVTMSGSGSVTWRAPLGTAADGCPSPFTAGSIPPASCFSPVALWSNVITTNFNAASQKNSMGGQSAMNLAGSFFTPNSVFNLSGQSPYSLTEAQFFARRLETSGQAALTMTPNPDTTIETPIFGSGLIR